MIMIIIERCLSPTLAGGARRRAAAVLGSFFKAASRFFKAASRFFKAASRHGVTS
jgi:hypothetical protein